MPPYSYPARRPPSGSSVDLRVWFVGLALILLIAAVGLGVEFYLKRGPFSTWRVSRPAERVSSLASEGVAAPVEETAEQRRLRSEFVKQEARAQLDPLIRRFSRKKAAYERSEDLYLERLYLWTLNFAVLQGLQQTPGTFAGDLPERDAFVYTDFVESAENLLAEVDGYLNRYAENTDSDFTELTRWQQDTNAAVRLAYPGSGSRLQDAIVAMKSARFKEIMASDNTRLVELTMVGGGHVVHTTTDAVQAAANFIQRLLNSH